MQLQVAVYATVLILSFILYFSIRKRVWRERFEEIYGMEVEEADLEGVFDRLRRLREIAESSDPRFRRLGHSPREPYWGWLEFAEANWRRNYEACRAAIVCAFL